jgi:hypothetical protein
VKPDQEDVLAAGKNWLQNWKDATFDLKHTALPTEEEYHDRSAGDFLGGRISIELVEPTWAPQKEGVEKSSWFTKEGVAKEEVEKSAAVLKEEDAEKEEGGEKKVGNTGNQAI